MSERWEYPEDAYSHLDFASPLYLRDRSQRDAARLKRVEKSTHHMMRAQPPLFRINTSLVSQARPFTQPRPFIQPLCWRLILHCCSALLQNLVGNSGVTQCLEEAEQQAEASVDVPPLPLQIVISVPICLFSLLFYLYPLSAPFLNPFSSPFPHFP